MSLERNRYCNDNRSLVLLKRMLLISVFSFGWLPVAAESGRPVTDDLGRKMDVPDQPERIILLATADVEILFALGVGKNIVGVPDGTRYPEDAKGIDKIGGMYGNFSAERILEKDPDLVLFTMSNWLQYRGHLDQLEQNGVTILGYDYPNTLNHIFLHILAVGNAVGRGEKARLLCDDLGLRIQKVKTVLNDLDSAHRPRVYWEWINEFVSAGGVKTYGRDSREDQLIRLSGGKNLFDDAKGNSFIVSNEEIIRRNPQVIILTANTRLMNGDEIIQKITSRPGWQDTDAVRNKRIYIVEEQITWANPRVVMGIETLSKCFHPELFE